MIQPLLGFFLHLAWTETMIQFSLILELTLHLKYGKTVKLGNKALNVFIAVKNNCI
jgi:hypothetical protein